MALTRTSCAPSSMASVLVRPITPHLAATYGARMPNPYWPAVEAPATAAPSASQTWTRAPPAANAEAIARPMPAPPAVTATWRGAGESAAAMRWGTIPYSAGSTVGEQPVMPGYHLVHGGTRVHASSEATDPRFDPDRRPVP